MKPLLELYAPSLREAGPKGRTLNLKQLNSVDPDMAVAFDRDVAADYKNAQVRQHGSTYVATAGGGKQWVYNDQERRWDPADRTGRSGARGSKSQKHDITGYYFGRDQGSSQLGSLLDHFSKTISEYQASLSGAADETFGEGWEDLIDSVYGPGTVKRLIRELWNNFWTDHEAINELAHFYDVAQQAAQGKRNDRRGTSVGIRRNWTVNGMEIEPLDSTAFQRALASYPAKVGPRYDIPQEVWLNDDGIDYLDDQWIRRQRVTDPSYFEQFSSNA